MERYGPFVISAASLAVAVVAIYKEITSRRHEDHVRALLGMTERCEAMSNVLDDVNKMLLEDNTCLIVPLYSCDPIFDYRPNDTWTLPDGKSIIRVCHHDVVFALSSNEEKHLNTLPPNAWATLVVEPANVKHRPYEFGAYVSRFMSVLSMLSVQEQLLRENNLSLSSVPLIVKKYIDMIAGEAMYKDCIEPHLLAAVHDFIVHRQHFGNDVESLIRRFYPDWKPTTMTDELVERTIREFRARHSKQRLALRKT